MAKRLVSNEREAGEILQENNDWQLNSLGFTALEIQPATQANLLVV